MPISLNYAFFSRLAWSPVAVESASHAGVLSTMPNAVPLDAEILRETVQVEK
jgi:hypothetical protein